MADEDNNNNMADLLNRRRVLKSKLTRMGRAVAAMNDQTTRAMIEVHDEHIDKIEVDVMKFEDDMLTSVQEEDLEAQTAECNQLIQRCLAVKASWRCLIQPAARNAPQGAGVATQGGIGVRTHIGVKLPKLETPTFSGDLHEWTAFRDRFTAAIHCKSEEVLTGSEKLEYLKASLMGEAAELIRAIQITDDNYLIAWELLVKRFENKREIAQAHLDRLLGQEAMQLGCGTSLRMIFNRTNECLRSLAVPGAPTETWGIIICYVIEKKSDHDTRQSWELTFGDGSFPKLLGMLEFLDRRARALLAAGSITTLTPEHNPGEKKTRAWQAAASCHLSETFQCAICREGHGLADCPKFLESGPAERRDVVLRSGLCFKCLLPGHVSQRVNAGECSLCQRNHHILLHLENEAVENAEIVNSNHIYNGSQKRSVLLPTAMVKVHDEGGRISHIRTLVDGGSQASFITEACAVRLGLQRVSTHISITGLGQTSMAGAREKVTVRIQSEFGKNFETEIKSYILPDVTGYRRHILRAKNWSHLSSLPLADPNFNCPGRVEMLLGADARGQIIRAGAVVGSTGTPYAELTAFGWVVSGILDNTEYSSLSCHSVTVTVPGIRVDTRKHRSDITVCLASTSSHPKKTERTLEPRSSG